MCLKNMFKWKKTIFTNWNEFLGEHTIKNGIIQLLFKYKNEKEKY